MAHLVPTAIPASLRAGDTATWRRTLADYPAPEGWALNYVLVKDSAQIAIAAVSDGSGFLVDVDIAATDLWVPGVYAWQERVTLSGKTYTTAAGSVEIIASFSAATGGLDARNHAQKTLAALEAWIEGHDLSVAEYEIAGRRMKFIPIADLLLLRDRYRREVRSQSGTSGRVYMKF